MQDNRRLTIGIATLQRVKGAMWQFEGDMSERHFCFQASIDCWAEIPAVAPCDIDVVTEDMAGLARSPAA